MREAAGVEEHAHTSARPSLSDRSARRSLSEAALAAPFAASTSAASLLLAYVSSCTRCSALLRAYEASWPCKEAWNEGGVCACAW